MTALVYAALCDIARDNRRKGWRLRKAERLRSIRNINRMIRQLPESYAIALKQCGDMMDRGL